LQHHPRTDRGSHFPKELVHAVLASRDAEAAENDFEEPEVNMEHFYGFGQRWGQTDVRGQSLYCWTEGKSLHFPTSLCLLHLPAF
jgi:hypothetical protein